MTEIKFEERKTIEQVEESTELAPKFDKDGLIPVVTTDFSSGEVLMQGYMYPCIKTSPELKSVVTTGIKPSLSNFGANSVDSSTCSIVFLSSNFISVIL